MRRSDWSAQSYLCLLITGGAALYGLMHPDHWSALPIRWLTPLCAGLWPENALWVSALAVFVFYNLPFVVFGAIFYRDPIEKVQRKAERLAGRIQRSANTGKDTRELVKRFGRE